MPANISKIMKELANRGWVRPAATKKRPWKPQIYPPMTNWVDDVIGLATLGGLGYMGVEYLKYRKAHKGEKRERSNRPPEQPIIPDRLPPGRR